MEEVLGPQTMEGAGFEPTRIRQFTVFMDNKVGRLRQLVSAYEEEGGRIISINVQSNADTALTRLICSDPDLGRQVLISHDFSFTEQDVLAVELPKRSKHPMIDVCQALLTAEINIHYLYPLLARVGGPALAMCVDDPTLAAQLLIRKGFTLVGESDLKK